MGFPWALKHIVYSKALTHYTSGSLEIRRVTKLQLALHNTQVFIAGRSLDGVKKAMEKIKASSMMLFDFPELKIEIKSPGSVKNRRRAPSVKSRASVF